MAEPDQGAAHDQAKGNTPSSRPDHDSVRYLERQDSCVMCSKDPASRCGRCKSCYYCSKECQISDWPSHKLLCKAFSTLSSRPSPNHKLAILFPAKKPRPALIWLPCEPIDDGYIGGRILVGKIKTYPHLGLDKPFEGTLRVEHNLVRGRELGRGFVGCAPQKEGYCVAIRHREAFMVDGSTLNRSVLASVGASGAIHYRFSGPMIALREVPGETFEDITLGDFRHIIDYFMTYAKSDVRVTGDPLPHAPNPQPPSSTIRGARICCLGEIKLHGSKPYVSVDIPKDHVALQSAFIEISPISKCLGMPLQLWKDSISDALVNLPGWHYSHGPASNGDAAFLMMDTEGEAWGWAPMHWQCNIGNVLAVRADGKDLVLDDLRAICYFVREKLQPMFEDTNGAGLVQRTKQSVLDFITWENMKKFAVDMDKDNGAFHLSRDMDNMKPVG